MSQSTLAEPQGALNGETPIIMENVARIERNGKGALRSAKKLVQNAVRLLDVQNEIKFFTLTVAKV